MLAVSHNPAPTFLPLLLAHPPAPPNPTGLTLLEELSLQGCRNLANPAGGASLSGLAALRRLTGLTLRGCDRLTGARGRGERPAAVRSRLTASQHAPHNP